MSVWFWDSKKWREGKAALTFFFFLSFTALWSDRRESLSRATLARAGQVTSQALDGQEGTTMESQERAVLERNKIPQGLSETPGW